MYGRLVEAVTNVEDAKETKGCLNSQKGEVQCKDGGRDVGGRGQGGARGNKWEMQDSRMGGVGEECREESKRGSQWERVGGGRGKR